MLANEMQLLGIVLIVAGVAVIAAAQILLTLWLNKKKQEMNGQEDSR